MKDWTGEYVTLIEDCEKRESRLNDWERKFVDSVKKQLADTGTLSRKQAEALDDIWNKATARG